MELLNKTLKSYRKYISKTLKGLLRSQNTEEYWRILNQRGHNKQPNIDFEKLLDFCKKLISSETNAQDAMNIPEIDINRIMTKIRLILNSEISKKEILKCVKSLKNDKACADYLKINEYIKSTCNQLLDIYVHFLI